MRNVVFTDAGTVKFLDKKEMTLPEFFTFFEKGIKNYKITDCNYDGDLNIYSFNYKENDSEYGKRCHICFGDRNTSSMPNELRILLTLLELEEGLRRQKEFEELVERNNEKMLEDARMGIIKTDEARKLYIDELRNSLGVKGTFLRFKEVSIDAKEKSGDRDDFLVGLHLFLALIFLFFALFTIGLFKKYILGGLFTGSFLFSTYSFVMMCNEIKPLGYIKNLIKGINKDIVRENKLIRYKISYLKKCSLESGISSVKINSLNEETSKRINKIFVKLASLKINDGGIRREFVLRLDEYKKKMEDILRGNLLSEEEQVIDREFLSYLDSVEERLDKLLGCLDENSQQYAFTGKPRGLVETNSNLKIKSRL